MDYAALYVNIGIFVATAGAAAVAWWQAIQANRASVDARQAQIAALTAWQESATALTRANDIAGMSARAGYASVLNELAAGLVGARFVGKPKQEVVQEYTLRLNEAAFLAGPDADNGIARWVTRFAESIDVKSSLAGGSMDSFDAMQLLGDRIRLWHRDPVAAAALIREDPRLPHGWDS